MTAHRCQCGTTISWKPEERTFTAWTCPQCGCVNPIGIQIKPRGPHNFPNTLGATAAMFGQSDADHAERKLNQRIDERFTACVGNRLVALESWRMEAEKTIDVLVGEVAQLKSRVHHLETGRNP
ncbi:MAG: hypothetical protein ACE5FA_00405 [Dehalococcoidia bacterium]